MDRLSSAIELRGINKSYDEVEALDDVSLDIEQGEFVSIVGPSGCGKTTLLRIVAGLIEPSAGVVRINGASPTLACQQHSLGIAFQQAALIPSLTSIQNVQLTLRVTQVKADPEELLCKFGLQGFLHAYPHELSGGMRQRVAVACMMAHDPPVLLMDEPFGALDAFTREKMGEWLSGIINHSGKTVLFVTHSIPEAVFLGDRVVILTTRPAQVAEEVMVDLPSPRTREVRFEKTFTKAINRIRHTLYEQ